MNCDDSKIKMMDYLYDELNPSEKKEFLDHVGDCTECKSEIRELGGAGKLLRSLPQKAPKKAVDVSLAVAEEPSPIKRTWKPVRYALAAVFLLFITASLANLEVEYGESGFRMSVSMFPTQPIQQGGINEDQMKLILAEREAALYEMFQQDRQQQQEHFALVLDEFMTAVEDQRASDLQLIANELYRIEDLTGYQLSQTDLLLYELLDYTP